MIDEIKVILTLILCEITKTEMARTPFLEMLAASLPKMDLQHFTTHCILMMWMLILMLYLIFFQLSPRLTRNFLKEGYMEKTGPRASNTRKHTNRYINIVNLYFEKMHTFLLHLLGVDVDPYNNIIKCDIFINQ